MNHKPLITKLNQFVFIDDQF